GVSRARRSVAGPGIPLARLRTSTMLRRTCPACLRSASSCRSYRCVTSRVPSLRLRDDADVGTRRLPALRVGLLRLVVGDGPGDDHVLALLPGERRRDLMRRGALD